MTPGRFERARRGIRKLVAGAALLLAFSVADVRHGAADAIRTGGTGASTELLRIIGERFATQPGGLRFDVIPSLGSSGGIAAVADGALDFAVSGRPLKPEEAAKGLTSVVLARSPFGLATTHADPRSLNKADVAAAYASEGAKWHDGSLVRIVLRPKSDSDTALIARMFPNVEQAQEQARRRTDVQVGATDQDAAALAEGMAGSLVGLSLLQVQTERRTLRFVTIDGVEPSVQNLESGRYPYAKDFHFVFAKASPIADRLIAFLRSAEGIALLRGSAALPGN